MKSVAPAWVKAGLRSAHLPRSHDLLCCEHGLGTAGASVWAAKLLRKFAGVCVCVRRSLFDATETTQHIIQ